MHEEIIATKPSMHSISFPLNLNLSFSFRKRFRIGERLDKTFKKAAFLSRLNVVNLFANVGCHIGKEIIIFRTLLL